MRTPRAATIVVPLLWVACGARTGVDELTTQSNGDAMTAADSAPRELCAGASTDGAHVLNYNL